MKRKEKERFIEIYNKLVQAEEVELDLSNSPTGDFFADQKFKGVKLSISDYTFFKPVLEAQYHVRYTTGNYECEITSAMYTSILNDGEDVYISFHKGFKTETLLHMRYLISLFCSPIRKVKYSDLLGANQ